MLIARLRRDNLSAWGVCLSFLTDCGKIMYIELVNFKVTMKSGGHWRLTLVQREQSKRYWSY
jgi:hypothetical protein